MNATKISTQTVQPRSWRIGGRVDGLREHGSARVHGLPDPPRIVKLGTASDLRLDSPTVSREHAELFPIMLDGQPVWKIHDLKSKNGLRCDGRRRKSCLLRPGVEIELGSLRLIPESDEERHLCSTLRLLLGWDAARQERVDQAIRSLRDWAELEADLVIVGEGNLEPVVRRLHHLVIGKDSPFTAFSPTGKPAEIVEAAGSGTLCVRPPDGASSAAAAAAIVHEVRATDYSDRPQLVLCAADTISAAAMTAGLDRLVMINVPPLTDRQHEMDRIVQSYAVEIARDHRLPGSELTMHDVDVLRSQAYLSLDEVEDDVLRAVMLRRLGPKDGAARVGITRPSLVTWARRRGLKT